MNEHYPFQVEPLPYFYDHLEPCISIETLHFHHDKHYAAYVDNLNKILDDYPRLQNMSLEQLITYVPHMPKAIQVPVLNNAGGVYNHQLYFHEMTHASGQRPYERMMALLQSDFGSYDNWKKAMTEAAMSVFGSGWAWLLQNNVTKRLAIQITPNQNTPDLTTFTPLLLVDVWEHAYYLQYQNLRAKYVECWFDLINWDRILPL